MFLFVIMYSYLIGIIEFVIMYSYLIGIIKLHDGMGIKKVFGSDKAVIYTKYFYYSESESIYTTKHTLIMNYNNY